jgi:hypothetical protein
LITTIAKIATASGTAPTAAETTQAPSSNAISGLRS